MPGSNLPSLASSSSGLCGQQQAVPTSTAQGPPSHRLRRKGAGGHRMGRLGDGRQGDGCHPGACRRDTKRQGLLLLRQLREAAW